MLAPSPDLIALTRSQMGILLQCLGLAMGAVYLAEEVAGAEPHLQEIFTYPDQYQLILPSPHMGETGMIHQGRMVLPLLYENNLLGFLTIGRASDHWTEGDLALIGKVVTTLTIAVVLDQRQQELYQQQKDFLARLLHQLRNPLTAIRTFAQLLWRRLAGDQRNQPLAQHILSETAHLQELLAIAEQPQPYLLASTDTPKLLPAANLGLANIDLRPIVAQLVANAEAIAQTRQLEFCTLIPSPLPLVRANPEALREVLANLLDNALKYTPAGGTVQLAMAVHKNQLEITVADTGLGIPPEDRDQLFVPRFRGRQADGDIAGTGLGLAIVSDLVQAMDAKITVESTVGRGSSFTVSLAIAHP